MVKYQFGFDHLSKTSSQNQNDEIELEEENEEEPNSNDVLPKSQLEDSLCSEMIVS